MDIEELVPRLMAVRRGEGFLLPVLLPALQIRLMREQGGVPGAVIQDALAAVILAVILMKAETLPGKR